MKFRNLLICFFVLLAPCFGQELSFVALDEKNNQIICALGKSCNQRLSPCSTFKIVLSLIGYEEGVLIDENSPRWPYRNYEAFMESWKNPQTPKTWMQDSVVWYSQVLTPLIGLEKINQHLAQFDYGNRDMSGDPGRNNGLTNAWLCSSLKISPIEQVHFVKKLVRHELPLSKHAVDLTKSLLYTETWENGWRLYGKTGSGYEQDENGDLDRKKVIAWYVGWIEKNDQIYIFALTMRDVSAFPPRAERIRLAKEFLKQSRIL